MAHSRQHAHGPALPALGLTFGLAFACPDITFATDLPIRGGLGGQEFRAECPKGSYLVGLDGRTGEWVDRIAPVCAPWLRGSQTLGAPSIGPSFGTSGGGQAVTRICPSSNGKPLVIRSWFIETLISANKFVQYVAAMCEPLAPSLPRTSEIVWFAFGSEEPRDVITYTPYGRPYTGRGDSQACPVSEVAVGFRVRAGQFVDAIGLICGPPPLGPSAPVAKLPTPLIHDMTFVITKPVAGERVPQGQLIIAATTPKVGVTNVTELELRYLDAPPTQRDSYPYLTVISVDTKRLAQGYPVDQLVTGAYSGRWQVRARSSMKTPPGPWSLSVQFQLVAPPRQTLPVQTSPLPSSSVTQPPSGSPTTQMKRSPSMIMPRGIEKDSVREGNQTVDEPPNRK